VSLSGGAGPPSLAGRTCVVTGANRGIGRATALGLATLGARVVMVCRDAGRGEEARAAIHARTGCGSIELARADLSSQRDVRRLATTLRERPGGLHVLIHNAAVLPRRRELTVDGLEMQLAVNHLAPFLLTNLLLDLLRSSAPARVVTVSSHAHRGARLDLDDLQSERRYAPTAVYSATKLANVLFTRELARRLAGTGVTANCLHPGVIATDLLGRFVPGPPWLGRLASRLIGRGLDRGAETSIHLASSPDVEGITGEYFARRAPARSSAASRDPELARALWDLSARLTGLETEERPGPAAPGATEPPPANGR